MIDKQIIIDGVDVNALYSDQIACMNRYEVANLFIKTVEQLKAKEEQLKQYKRSKQASYELLQQECNKVVLENRKLKEELKVYKECYFCDNRIEPSDKERLRKCSEVRDCFMRQLNQLKAENIKFTLDSKKLVAQYSAKLERLKQTLTEIKEIVGIGLVDGLQPEEYSGFLKILQAQILQKISEVEDGNN